MPNNSSSGLTNQLTDRQNLMKKLADYKITSDSETIKTEVVCPTDTNPMGLLQGGRLVQWMDIAAAVCAQTHAGKICVTACINDVDFNNSAKIGDVINITANVTRAFSTSMEVFVRAFARKILTGKKYLISEAYFTFVALDKNEKAVPVIGVKPVTPMEKELYDLALRRRVEKKISRKTLNIST